MLPNEDGDVSVRVCSGGDWMGFFNNEQECDGV
jgi:hypothetical protein